ncbi:hypothetical protein D3C78_1734870 [compost metagenome]
MKPTPLADDIRDARGADHRHDQHQPLLKVISRLGVRAVFGFQLVCQLGQVVFVHQCGLPIKLRPSRMVAQLAGYWLSQTSLPKICNGLAGT